MKGSQAKSYQFVFERRELGLLLAGFGVILVLTFLLGMVVGKRSSSHPLTAKGEIPEMCPIPPAEEPEATDAVQLPPVATQPLEREEQLQVEEEELTFYSTLPDSSVDAPATSEQSPAPSPPSESTPPSPPQEGTPPQAQAPDEQPEEVAAVQQAPPQGFYSIQVGSFRERAPAQALAQGLKAKGYPAVVRAAELAGDGIWYRVRVEGYRERSEAERMARMIEEREKLPVLVLREGE